MNDSASNLFTYPMRRGSLLDLPPEYARLRSSQPIARVRLGFDGREVWLVTRHEDACAILSDARFSSDFLAPGFPRPMTPNPPIPGTFIRLDPPDHTRLRGALVAEFKPRRVEAMRPAIQRIVDELIDGLQRRTPPVDLVECMTLPMPERVICELLGVPYADRGFFHERIRVIGLQTKSLQRHAEIRSELEQYLEKLIAFREREPSNDLLSRLVLRHQQLGDISRQEIVGIGTLLLIAGYETIANMIGLGTLVLLHHRDQLEAVRADPRKLTAAIEELLRYQTVIAFGLRRAATADVEIGGQLIRAGDGVIVSLDSANRDESVFPQPDRFDVHRQVNHHVAFGFGLHACVGQVLARLELEVLWSTLFSRMPAMRLAVPLSEVPFKTDTFVHGLHQLPVTW